MIGSWPVLFHLTSSLVPPPSLSIILKQIPDILRTGLRMPFFKKKKNPKNLDSAA